jgi:hypothetical protein
VTRDRIGPALVALLALVSLALAATALDESATAGGGGLGPGESDGQLGGGSGAPPPDPPPVADLPALSPELAAMIVAGVVLAVGYVLYRTVREYGVRDLLVSAVVFTAIVLVAALVVANLGPLGQAFGGTGTNATPGASPGGGSALGPADQEGSTNTTVPTAVLALLAIGVVGVGLLVLRTADASLDPEPAVGDDHTADDQRTAVADAAATAADELAAGADLDNAVYRAWREMTAALDVTDPETSTPGEFAAAAVDAGFDREAVTDLTQVFEEVRYGGQPAAGDRERRAEAALRRIQDAVDTTEDAENAPDADGGEES